LKTKGGKLMTSDQESTRRKMTDAYHGDTMFLGNLALKALRIENLENNSQALARAS
jgi:hypothetical protein